ncbi:MAG: PhnD/SsuA/transferrin family substrate-binding protein [Deltaproteobacteria bacterium]
MSMACVALSCRRRTVIDGQMNLLAYLRKATGYRFELQFARNAENVIDLLGTKKLDFAFLGAVHYLDARKKYGVIPLVRGLNSGGKSEYRSAIVVKTGSPLKGVNELRGKSVLE